MTRKRRYRCIPTKIKNAPLQTSCRILKAHEGFALLIIKVSEEISMRREDIVNELNKRGYRAEKYDTLKNGTLCRGIVIKTESKLSPVIYTDNLIRKEEQRGKSVAHAADLIVGIYEAHKDMVIDQSLFLDSEFVLSHVRVGVQKQSAENLERGYCKIPGLETYLYLACNEEKRYSVKISPDYLEKVDIEPIDVWEAAYKNTFKETCICSMDPSELDIGEWACDLQMYVVTNREKEFGASAILDCKALSKLDEEIENETHKFLVLPCSIHKMIVIPYDEKYGLEEMMKLMKAVNKSMEKPEEQLMDSVYIMELR